MDEPLNQILIIKPVQSRYLAVFITAVHLGAMVAVAGSGLPTHYKVIAIIVVLGAFMQALRVWWGNFDHGTKHEFMLTVAGEWSRRGPGEKVEPLVAIPPAFVHPVLIVVRLRSDSDPRVRHDLILLPDNLDPDTSRRLRVRLRLPP